MSAVTDLDLLVSLVNCGHLVLLVQRRFVTEEAHQIFVSEAEELDLLVVFAGIGAPLSVEDGVQGKGRVALHNVGQFETRGEERISEGPPALGTVTHSVKLLSAPMFGNALTAEVMLATKTDRVLVDAQTDGTEELILQTASHLQRQRLSCI